jgi:hypothetical protein
MNPCAIDIDAYLGKYDRAMDRGLTEREKAERRAAREDLLPLVKEIDAKIKERIQSAGKREVPNAE